MAASRPPPLTIARTLSEEEERDRRRRSVTRKTRPLLALVVSDFDEKRGPIVRTSWPSSSVVEKYTSLETLASLALPEGSHNHGEDLSVGIFTQNNGRENYSIRLAVSLCRHFKDEGSNRGARQLSVTALLSTFAGQWYRPFLAGLLDAIARELGLCPQTVDGPLSVVSSISEGASAKTASGKKRRDKNGQLLSAQSSGKLERVLKPRDGPRVPAGSDEERRLLKAMLTTIGETVLTESESFGHAYVPYLQKSIELPPRVSSVDDNGDVGIGDLITLVRAFRSNTILLWYAVLLEKRVLVYAPTSGAASVLSSSIPLLLGPLGSGVLPCLTPYVSLHDLTPIYSASFVCGCTNPLFISKKDWYDALCDVPSGSISFASEPIKLSSRDKSFMKKIMQGIDKGNGEEWYVYKPVNTAHELIDRKGLKARAYPPIMKRVVETTLYSRYAMEEMPLFTEPKRDRPDSVKRQKSSDSDSVFSRSSPIHSPSRRSGQYSDQSNGKEKQAIQRNASVTYSAPGPSALRRRISAVGDSPFTRPPRFFNDDDGGISSNRTGVPSVPSPFPRSMAPFPQPRVSADSPKIGDHLELVPTDFVATPARQGREASKKAGKREDGRLALEKTGVYPPSPPHSPDFDGLDDRRSTSNEIPTCPRGNLSQPLQGEREAGERCGSWLSADSRGALESFSHLQHTRESGSSVDPGSLFPPPTVAAKYQAHSRNAEVGADRCTRDERRAKLWNDLWSALCGLRQKFLPAENGPSAEQERWSHSVFVALGREEKTANLVNQLSQLKVKRWKPRKNVPPGSSDSSSSPVATNKNSLSPAQQHRREWRRSDGSSASPGPSMEEPPSSSLERGGGRESDRLERRESNESWTQSLQSSEAALKALLDSGTSSFDAMVTGSNHSRGVSISSLQKPEPENGAERHALHRDRTASIASSSGTGEDFNDASSIAISVSSLASSSKALSSAPYEKGGSVRARKDKEDVKEAMQERGGKRRRSSDRDEDPVDNLETDKGTAAENENSESEVDPNSSGIEDDDVNDDSEGSGEDSKEMARRLSFMPSNARRLTVQAALGRRAFNKFSLDAFTLSPTEQERALKNELEACKQENQKLREIIQASEAEQNSASSTLKKLEDSLSKAEEKIRLLDRDLRLAQRKSLARRSLVISLEEEAEEEEERRQLGREMEQHMRGSPISDAGGSDKNTEARRGKQIEAARAAVKAEEDRLRLLTEELEEKRKAFASLAGRAYTLFTELQAHAQPTGAHEKREAL